MMPLIFMILGLILRLSLSKALKAGLMVGIGFIGLSITVNLMIDSLTPVSHALVERFGLNLTVLDVGWPARRRWQWGRGLARWSFRCAWLLTC
ncbi:PTS system galactitol-specific EIIC component [Raoultella terrigena]|uniref:PTS system galactitol-specific EIIC component n=1 Tax=Raoultella terrigena TaxID=577 RepID=A0A3P8IT05_RAOTE|nr:PTS system galactitol-specific EIIC component [Raoultella terrigena]